MTSELREFMRDALRQGMPRAEIREKLLAAGWRPEEVQTSLDAFAEIESPVPVPRRRPYLSARETFFYLVLFVTLYLTAINVCSILFQLVNRAIPDVTGTGAGGDTFSPDAARGAIAGLMIAFPIFLFMARLLGRAINEDPEKRTSKIRKWLTYITLFVSACFMIGDLTFLLTQVLSGELILRVGLKALAVFLISGMIFVHYISDLRREEDKAQLGPSRPSWLARFAGAAVLATLIAGLFTIGWPRQERLRKIDAVRIDNLIGTSQAVESYYREHGALPDSLAALLTLRPDQVAPLNDPISGERYGYRIVDSTTYELSASFATVDTTGGNRVGIKHDSMNGPRFWLHGAGRWSYTLTVRPETSRGTR